VHAFKTYWPSGQVEHTSHVRVSIRSERVGAMSRAAAIKQKVCIVWPIINNRVKILFFVFVEVGWAARADAGANDFARNSKIGQMVSVLI